MTKEEFVKRRTEIISKMLDNPNDTGIYPTSVAFAELDDLYDELTGEKVRSKAQTLRDVKKNFDVIQNNYEKRKRELELDSVVNLKHED